MYNLNNTQKMLLGRVCFSVHVHVHVTKQNGWEEREIGTRQKSRLTTPHETRERDER